VLGEEQPPNNPVGFAAAAVAERTLYTDYTTRRDQASAIISGSCCNEVQIKIEEIDDPVEMWITIARKMDATSTVVVTAWTLSVTWMIIPVVSRCVGFEDSAYRIRVSVWSGVVFRLACGLWGIRVEGR
jgi:hypothetical protein